MVSYKQVKIIAVDEDVPNGMSQLNETLKTMQLDDKFEIIDVKPNGNFFYIFYSYKYTTDEQTIIEDQNGIYDTVEPSIQQSQE